MFLIVQKADEYKRQPIANRSIRKHVLSTAQKEQNTIVLLFAQHLQAHARHKHLIGHIRHDQQACDWALGATCVTMLTCAAQNVMTAQFAYLF